MIRRRNQYTATTKTQAGDAEADLITVRGPDEHPRLERVAGTNETPASPLNSEPVIHHEQVQQDRGHEQPDRREVTAQPPADQEGERQREQRIPPTTAAPSQGSGNGKL